MAFVLIVDDEQTRQLRDPGVSLGVLFEKAPDPYFLGNLKGAFIDVNKAAEKLTGYSREELIGKSFLKLKLLSPRQIAKASTLIARNALGKDTGPDEFILTRKDGKQVPVEIRTHPVKIQGKQVVLGLVRDITERKRAKEALARSQELVKQAGQIAKVGGWEVDVQTLEVTWNEETYRIHELPLDQHPPLDKALDFFDPEDRTKLRHAIERALSHGEPYDLELRLTTAKGNRLWTHSICTPKVVDGKTVKLVGIFQDITIRKQAEEALHQTSEKIEHLHQIVRDLAACEDEDQVYRLTVQAAERTLSFSVCTLDIVEEDRLVVKATSSASPSRASQESELKEGGLAAKTYRTKETIVFGRMEDVPEATPVREDIRSGISAPIGDIGVFQAISTKPDAFTQNDARMIDLLLGHAYEAIRRIRLQEDLKHQAIHDPLTGVYNRRYFDQTIETELQRSKRYDHPISFLMIDIDRFKEINDTYGHQMGDKVLQAVAELLSDQVRENDLVVRYGGDEFLIVLPETDGELEVIRERIQQAVVRRNKENPLLDFPVTLSIGAAHWRPEDDLPIEQVLAKADERMYEEKRQKSNE
jgi:diguanylate cyclase (GGDEF)-like protein/PAS domain S-box-containing protein